MAAHDAHAFLQGQAFLITVRIEQTAQSLVDGMVVDPLIEGLIDRRIEPAAGKMIVNLQVQAAVIAWHIAFHQLLPNIQRLPVGIVGQSGLPGVDIGTSAAQQQLIFGLENATQKGRMVQFQTVPIDSVLAEIDVLQRAIGQTVLLGKEFPKCLDAADVALPAGPEFHHAAKITQNSLQALPEDHPQTQTFELLDICKILICIYLLFKHKNVSFLQKTTVHLLDTAACRKNRASNPQTGSFAALNQIQ